ncbi:hypothetical protein [Mycobacterium sp. Z3061]|uniref:hypothetical protein n=1 Tax=Mycobacterium sp. Z3061 TaxID=3073562 RepID=UPI002872ACFE|nr:hypothetical protein [Mycobacterium sp. Z3061]
MDAVAGFAMCTVIERRATGNGVRFSRSHDSYTGPKRYRNKGRLHTYNYVTKAADILEAAGLIRTEMGTWHLGFQSVAWATDLLMLTVGSVLNPDELPAPDLNREVIILRDRQDKRQVDYTDTPWTEAMREEVRKLNAELAKVELYQGSYRLDIPLLCRIFNGDFSRGGRWYCGGNSWQNMPKRARSQLTMSVNGRHQRVVEEDYFNLHISMAYAESGREMPPGDQYDIRGFPRQLGKLGVNILFNAQTQNGAVLAIADEIHRSAELQQACGASSHRGQCRKVAEGVVAAILKKHRKIAGYFGSDCGARFQRRDSVMALEVMKLMLKRTGRCPLPLHDSFLVPECDAKVLADTMIEVALHHGLTTITLQTTNQTGHTAQFPQLQVLPHHSGPTHSLYLEDTSSELRQQRGGMGQEGSAECLWSPQCWPQDWGDLYEPVTPRHSGSCGGRDE